MWKSIVISFIALEVLEIQGSRIPAYFKPCSKSKDFKTCAVKNGNEALPFLLKGDKTFKIPNLLPLKFPLVDVDAGPNLKVKLIDIELYGIDTVTLKDMDIDFAKQTVYLDLDAKHVELIGKYDIDGKILILPIQGSGFINLTAEACNFKYTFTYKLETRGDSQYAIIQDDDKLDYKITKAYFRLDNLFNGNQAMGENVNKFLNENDQEVIKELGGAVEGTVRAIARKVGGGVIANIPFDELFLE